MTDVKIRQVKPDDKPEWLRMRISLWPHHDPNELEQELDKLLANQAKEPVFVAERPEKGLCGFIEVSIRDKAKGCKTKNVGYIEGWYVDSDMRQKGIGRMLVQAAENWARNQGCQEMASDTTNNYPISRTAHKSLGYEEIEISFHYRKLLIPNQ
jgi:aminoglycoside 6'-N-acetyltransferase I